MWRCDFLRIICTWLTSLLGAQTGKGVMRVLLAIGAPLIIAIVWGVFGSPRSQVQLSMSMHIMLELLVFGLPSVALYATGKHWIGYT
ncbi:MULTISPECIES: YrdB family protein [Priestia]|nr:MULTISPECIES: YrdB family protein [Priestia]